MDNQQPFQDMLDAFMQQTCSSAGRLARLSTIPKQTIISWLQGRVKKPHRWQDVVRVAAALHLNEADATLLLRSAGHLSISELQQVADNGTERTLLATWPARQVPFQAIADLAHFVGREAEFASAQEALLNGRAVAITSLEGMGGVGKTSLAAHLAHRLRPHFPDGVLWARLDTSEPLSILSTFAAAYGRDVSDYPDLDSRSRVVRELLAEKRALVVLDNAERDEQVQPLLPASGRCAVIITSRRRDLWSARCAFRLALRPFDPQRQEALALFARVLGEEVVNQGQAELAATADLLGHLPLAVDIAASRLAHEPGWTVTAFLARLRREQQRLAELAYGDTSLQLSCNVSYRALPAAQQRFFICLTVFGGEDFAPEAAAFVARLSTAESEDSLRRLYSLSLLRHGRPGRWRLHPLLRSYTREKLGDESLWARMVTYFVEFVIAYKQDYQALESDLGNILHALEVAGKQRLRADLVRGVTNLAPFLEVRGLYALAETHLLQALAAAQEEADSLSQSRILHQLGRFVRRRGQYRQAQQYLWQGLDLARQLNRDQESCVLLRSLGSLAMLQGSYDQAERYLTEGLKLARQWPYSETLCLLLEGLGLLSTYRGEYTQAEDYLQAGVKATQRLGDRKLTGSLLMNLGVVYQHLGRYAQAEALFQEALFLAHQIDDRAGKANLLANLGTVAERRGNLRDAAKYWQEGLAVARQVEEQTLMTMLLTNLGSLATGDQEYGQPQTYLQEALELAHKLGNPEQASAALEGLGLMYIEIEKYGQAWEHLLEGLSLARKSGNHLRLSRILIVLGQLYLKQQDCDKAETAFSESLAVAGEAGLQECAADAYYGLAQVAAAVSDFVTAHDHGWKSLTTLEKIGHRRAGEVRQWLANILASREQHLSVTG
jgi:tetratricopeptide (TPR) repeat protein